MAPSSALATSASSASAPTPASQRAQRACGPHALRAPRLYIPLQPPSRPCKCRSPDLDDARLANSLVEDLADDLASVRRRAAEALERKLLGGTLDPRVLLQTPRASETIVYLAGDEGKCDVDDAAARAARAAALRVVGVLVRRGGQAATAALVEAGALDAASAAGRSGGASARAGLEARDALLGCEGTASAIAAAKAQVATEPPAPRPAAAPPAPDTAASTSKSSPSPRPTLLLAPSDLRGWTLPCPVTSRGEDGALWDIATRASLASDPAGASAALEAAARLLRGGLPGAAVLAQAPDLAATACRWAAGGCGGDRSTTSLGADADADAPTAGAAARRSALRFLAALGTSLSAGLRRASTAALAVPAGVAREGGGGRDVVPATVDATSLAHSTLVVAVPLLSGAGAGSSAPWSGPFGRTAAVADAAACVRAHLPLLRPPLGTSDMQGEIDTSGAGRAGSATAAQLAALRVHLSSAASACDAAAYLAECLRGRAGEGEGTAGLGLAEAEAAGVARLAAWSTTLDLAACLSPSDFALACPLRLRQSLLDWVGRPGALASFPSLGSRACRLAASLDGEAAADLRRAAAVAPLARASAVVERLGAGGAEGDDKSEGEARIAVRAEARRIPLAALAWLPRPALAASAVLDAAVDADLGRADAGTPPRAASPAPPAPQAPWGPSSRVAAVLSHPAPAVRSAVLWSVVKRIRDGGDGRADLLCAICSAPEDFARACCAAGFAPAGVSAASSSGANGADDADASDDEDGASSRLPAARALAVVASELAEAARASAGAPPRGWADGRAPDPPAGVAAAALTALARWKGWVLGLVPSLEGTARSTLAALAGTRPSAPWAGVAPLCLGLLSTSAVARHEAARAIVALGGPAAWAHARSGEEHAVDRLAALAAEPATQRLFWTALETEPVSAAADHPASEALSADDARRLLAVLSSDVHGPAVRLSAVSQLEALARRSDASPLARCPRLATETAEGAATTALIGLSDGPRGGDASLLVAPCLRLAAALAARHGGVVFRPESDLRLWRPLAVASLISDEAAAASAGLAVFALRSCAWAAGAPGGFEPNDGGAHAVGAIDGISGAPLGTDEGSRCPPQIADGFHLPPRLRPRRAADAGAAVAAASRRPRRLAAAMAALESPAIDSTTGTLDPAAASAAAASHRSPAPATPDSWHAAATSAVEALGAARNHEDALTALAALSSLCVADPAAAEAVARLAAWAPPLRAILRTPPVNLADHAVSTAALEMLGVVAPLSVFPSAGAGGVGGEGDDVPSSGDASGALLAALLLQSSAGPALEAGCPLLPWTPLAIVRAERGGRTTLAADAAAAPEVSAAVRGARARHAFLSSALRTWEAVADACARRADVASGARVLAVLAGTRVVNALAAAAAPSGARRPDGRAAAAPAGAEAPGDLAPAALATLSALARLAAALPNRPEAAAAASALRGAVPSVVASGAAWGGAAGLPGARGARAAAVGFVALAAALPREGISQEVDPDVDNDDVVAWSGSDGVAWLVATAEDPATAPEARAAAMASLALLASGAAGPAAAVAIRGAWPGIGRAAANMAADTTLAPVTRAAALDLCATLLALAPAASPEETSPGAHVATSAPLWRSVAALVDPSLSTPPHPLVVGAAARLLLARRTLGIEAWANDTDSNAACIAVQFSAVLCRLAPSAGELSSSDAPDAAWAGWKSSWAAVEAVGRLCKAVLSQPVADEADPAADVCAARRRAAIGLAAWCGSPAALAAAEAIRSAAVSRGEGGMGAALAPASLAARAECDASAASAASAAALAALASVARAAPGASEGGGLVLADAAAEAEASPEAGIAALLGAGAARLCGDPSDAAAARLVGDGLGAVGALGGLGGGAPAAAESVIGSAAAAAASSLATALRELASRAHARAVGRDSSVGGAGARGRPRRHAPAGPVVLASPHPGASSATSPTPEKTEFSDPTDSLLWTAVVAAEDALPYLLARASVPPSASNAAVAANAPARLVGALTSAYSLLVLGEGGDSLAADSAPTSDVAVRVSAAALRGLAALCAPSAAARVAVAEAGAWAAVDRVWAALSAAGGPRGDASPRLALLAFAARCLESCPEAAAAAARADDGPGLGPTSGSGPFRPDAALAALPGVAARSPLARLLREVADGASRDPSWGSRLADAGSSRALLDALGSVLSTPLGRRAAVAARTHVVLLRRLDALANELPTGSAAAVRAREGVDAGPVILACLTGVAASQGGRRALLGPPPRPRLGSGEPAGPPTVLSIAAVALSSAPPAGLSPGPELRRSVLGLLRALSLDPAPARAALLSTDGAPALAALVRAVDGASNGKDGVGGREGESAPPDLIESFLALEALSRLCLRGSGIVQALTGPDGAHAGLGCAARCRAVREGVQLALGAADGPTAGVDLPSAAIVHPAARALAAATVRAAAAVEALLETA